MNSISISVREALADLIDQIIEYLDELPAEDPRRSGLQEQIEELEAAMGSLLPI